MDKKSFKGYIRKNGCIGIRNTVFILYTVNCALHVARSIRDAAIAEGIPAQLIGNGPCFDNQVVIRRMLHCIAHGNTGAVLIVGHGCEFIQARKLKEFADNIQKPNRLTMDQTVGTERAIADGIEKIRELWNEIRSLPRADIPTEKLCVGILGSPRTKTYARAMDVGKQIIDGGASLLVSEYFCSADRIDALVSAAPDIARKQLRSALQKAMEFARLNHIPIESGDFGSVPRINGVLKLTQLPPHPGLWYVDTIQDHDPETGPCAASIADRAIDLYLSGAHIILYPMDRGEIAGCIGAPLLSLCDDPKISSCFPGEIDCLLSPAGEDNPMSTLFDAINGQLLFHEEMGIFDGFLHACMQD